MDAIAEKELRPYWAVCRTFSNRVPWVRAEIEKIDHGTFFPTYARIWNSGGKMSSRERSLMPGYLFFMTTEKGWGDVANIEGVYRVLSHDGKASKVSDAEMWQLVVDHATGANNDIDLSWIPRLKSLDRRRRSRKPRPGKRARSAA
jgi:transcription antitermination factor NusG